MCTLCVVADCGAGAGWELESLRRKSGEAEEKNRKNFIILRKAHYKEFLLFLPSRLSGGGGKIENMRIYIRITSLPNVP